MLKSVIYSITLLFLLLCTGIVQAQCPVNIGFDMGDFTNWVGYTGFINPDGSISVPTQGIVDGRQTIITRASQQVDPYGGFPLASPNGSSTCVRLGNDGTGKQAERLTYTLTIPADRTDFSLIYYYAVVFQNPNHTPIQQPKFTANVYDVTLGQYADCGSFTFVASGNLPGFQQASVGTSVFYKDWSPVTINLAGYAGKTIRLEFTTNDCSLGGHFGYAYLDINQNCTSPVSGNVICQNSTSVTLTAPSGFAAYQWYNGTDFSNIISTTSTYTVSPLPPVGTKYSVVIVPFPGLGCQDTITTTIQAPENLALNVVSSVSSCKSQGADITTAAITAGTDPEFSFTYYTDAPCTNFIVDPTNITDSGTYYIKATTPSGCFFVKPIKVSFYDSPSLAITNPAAVCAPALVNITTPAVTAGSYLGSNLTYWTDAAATASLANPTKIAKTGTYYIKATSSNGCFDIKPVTVLVNDLPVLQTHATIGCNTADITASAVTNGSSFGSTYTYWTDAEATVALTNANAITQDGVYYIQATNSSGCSVIAPVTVNVYPYPQITVTNPAAVVFPQTVDITKTYTPQTGTSYFFYQDSLATKLLGSPDKIGTRGTYYIKAVNGDDCALIVPVKVTINPPPDIDFTVNTFTPNGDGINDKFRIVTPDSYKVTHFRIYGSWGGLLFDATDSNDGWDGTYNGKKMPVGTYYWIFEGFDTYLNKPIKKSGSITLVM
jgi:gliding motility-associated-like protein